MKVIFTFPGLAHYLTAQLNKLSSKGIEVAAIIPQSKSASVGSGVHMAKDAEGFRVIEGNEKKSFIGKPIFENLEEILETEHPDILVIGWPYALDLVFNTSLKNTIKRLGIKLIYKGIPFNLPKRNEIIKFYHAGKYSGDESAEQFKPSFVGLLKFYVITVLRGFYLRKVDAHVYYINEAKDIVKSYGVEPSKVFITYNSPDTDLHLKTYKEILQEPLMLKPDVKRIIHVGRLVKWKRVDLLIEAYRKLKLIHTDLELIVVGGGPELENLKAQAGNDASIIFTGAIYDAKVLGKYLKESSVYVLAGMGGLSINEAMCYAKPIVCSIADGTEKEIVREGENGYFFENGNLGSLTEKINLILSDAELCKRMGEKSLKIIEEEVNLDIIAERYVKAFEYVLMCS